MSAVSFLCLALPADIDHHSGLPPSVGHPMGDQRMQGRISQAPTAAGPSTETRTAEEHRTAFRSITRFGPNVRFVPVWAGAPVQTTAAQFSMQRTPEATTEGALRTERLDRSLPIAAHHLIYGIRTAREAPDAELANRTDDDAELPRVHPSPSPSDSSEPGSDSDTAGVEARYPLTRLVLIPNAAIARVRAIHALLTQNLGRIEEHTVLGTEQTLIVQSDAIEDWVQIRDLSTVVILPRNRLLKFVVRISLKSPLLALAASAALGAFLFATFDTHFKCACKFPTFTYPSFA